MSQTQHRPNDDFVVANEVRIIAADSAHYGRTGEISIYDVDAPEEEAPYQVTFNRDLGDEAWFFYDEIELVE
jgi:hypothetical protein